MKPEPKVELFSKFLKEFQSETDRGASILAGSMLDQKLKDILVDFVTSPFLGQVVNIQWAV